MIEIVQKTAIPKNGLGSFIRPCQRIELSYCNWGGSSKSMKEFLSKKLAAIAKTSQDIEFHVYNQQGKHPLIRAFYNTGREKTICTRKMDANQITDKIMLCRDSDGLKPRFIKQPVESTNPSVRGVWSPFSETAESYRVYGKN
ncbi:ribosomal protein subunit L51 [Schizosaccharomyces cryophilus OY26]|uniref:Large ribosomal subunit protein mL43 n=1 Tax=Schizosaccharomyces cryophilus (strain OY26 / ATCC MYA-4695 / CBS 11777 / NBRC 106824 / NRRL Y48691) TaxID=653667 RepID=S9X529_SCHCR|nr:ribosomal protein subunit L51 [Schizosaccharomyces cryophilus OY26]EPY52192.1 ribosomal protein subunit L51 [Schizosaccharomyces cryophilus OY26]